MKRGDILNRLPPVHTQNYIKQKILRKIVLARKSRNGFRISDAKRMKRKKHKEKEKVELKKETANKEIKEKLKEKREEGREMEEKEKKKKRKEGETKNVWEKKDFSACG